MLKDNNSVEKDSIKKIKVKATTTTVVDLQ